MDVDTIEPGVDFFDELEAAVAECEILIAVIGPDWQDARLASGERRILQANDLVRSEIAAALTRNIRVIPVLVDGAVMPLSDELPAELVSLTRRNAISVTHERFAGDVERLVQAIKRTQPKRRNLLHVSGAIVAATAIVAVPFIAAPDILQGFLRGESRSTGITETAKPTGDIVQSRKPKNSHISTPVQSPKVSRGLAKISLHGETLILYATEDGRVALDGQGSHSPFSEAFSGAIINGITDIEFVAKKVISEVRASTKNLQRPIYESNLTRSINLADKGYEKLALIVGNSGYTHATPLNNPANDAQNIARHLGHLGFETIVSFDSGITQLQRTIHKFAERLKSGTSNTIGVFYYAGHALQVNGENYIIPIDAKLERASDLEFETLSIQDIVRSMKIGNLGATIIILDACRDDPFGRQLMR